VGFSAAWLVICWLAALDAIKLDIFNSVLFDEFDVIVTPSDLDSGILY
jgi:hypothetical protein